MFTAAKCHVSPSRVKPFMKQIKCLKSLLQCCGSVHVYKMLDREDGELQLLLFLTVKNFSN